MNTKLSASLSPVYSPWDQSGWRCERGRCRCSRSRQRGELHRPSRASRARPTHGVQMHVASAGVAAVAVPGRSSPTRELACCGPTWPTLLRTGQHSLSHCVSTAGSSLCVMFCIFLHVVCRHMSHSSLITVSNIPKHQVVICCLKCVSS